MSLTQIQDERRSTDSMSITDARQLIRSYQMDAPINISKMISAFGLSIFQAPLPPGFSGKIFRDPSTTNPSGYTIYVAPGEGKQRQRFTAAHELAHYVLHRDMIRDGINDDTLYRSGLPSRIEREANDLAADILMPWHLINEKTAEGITNVSQLADIFDVSLTAMSVRLGLPT